MNSQVYSIVQHDAGMRSRALIDQKDIEDHLIKTDSVYIKLNYTCVNPRCR